MSELVWTCLIQANYFMMQQGGVASITKPNAYLVRKTKKQQEQQQKLILQAAIFSLVDKKFDDIQ